MHTGPELTGRAAEGATSPSRDAVQRWRLVLRRDLLQPGRSQREQLAEWDAALVTSGLPLAGLDALRPKPRHAFAAPLAASTPGEAELMDIWLVERLARWRVHEALVRCIPDRYELVDLYDVWLGEPPLPGRVTASVYRAELPGSVEMAAFEAASARLMEATTLPRERRKGEATVVYDLRPLLDGFAITPRPGGGAIVWMTLLHDPTRGVGRPEEALAALGEAVGGLPEVARLSRERLVLAEPTAEAPQGPKGLRRPRYPGA